jgi:hypothetical protein
MRRNRVQAEIAEIIRRLAAHSEPGGFSNGKYSMIPWDGMAEARPC